MFTGIGSIEPHNCMKQAWLSASGYRWRIWEDLSDLPKDTRPVSDEATVGIWVPKKMAGWAQRQGMARTHVLGEPEVEGNSITFQEGGWESGKTNLNLGLEGSVQFGQDEINVRRRVFRREEAA